MTARRALSLLELLLVLALLVVVAALVLPALANTMENQRLSKAGDVVRASWNNARVRAMRSGRIHMFRYSPGGNQYYVEPWFAVTDEIESSDKSWDTSAGNADLQAALAVRANPEELPEGVTFVQAQTFFDSRDQAATEDIAGAGLPLPAAPILFYPDGTTSTTRLLLMNEQESYVVVQLRGLTGIAKVSELLTPAELIAWR